MIIIQFKHLNLNQTFELPEQLDKVYFEYGGGGNGFESYSAAWYFGTHHTKLDCWNRGKRGIIITILVMRD